MLRLLLLLLLLCALAGRPNVPGVIAWRGPCDVDLFIGCALVLACPGHDLLRLWPWPVMTPWWEDPPGPFGPEIAGPPL